MPTRGDKATISAHTGRLDGQPLDGQSGTVLDTDTDGTVWVDIGGLRVPVTPDEVR